MSRKKKERGNINKNKNQANLKKYNVRWIFLISIWTFLIAILVSLISENIMRNLDIFLAALTLILIILIGIIFDTIGIAVASAKEKPFHAMAANRITEAKYAVKLVRNAVPVSNFCNDVVGDICGIISGAAGTIIVMKLIDKYGLLEATSISIIMSGIIASLTVGGKAFGKEIALKKADRILFFTSKVIMFLHLKFGISLLPDLKKRRR